MSLYLAYQSFQKQGSTKDVAALDGATTASSGIDGIESMYAKSWWRCAPSRRTLRILRVHEAAAIIGLDRAQVVDEQIEHHSLLNDLCGKDNH